MNGPASSFGLRRGSLRSQLRFERSLVEATGVEPKSLRYWRGFAEGWPTSGRHWPTSILIGLRFWKPNILPSLSPLISLVIASATLP